MVEVLDAINVYRMECPVEMAVKSEYASIDLAERDLPGRLYVNETHSTPPWIALLAGHNYPGVAKATNFAGVWVVPHTDNTAFALAFGHGRHMLHAGRRLHNFGIRTVLNMLSAADRSKAVRAVRKRTIGSNLPHARHQSDVGIELGDFDIDFARDLVRGIEAIPEIERLGARVVGADSLKVVRKIDPKEILAVLEEYWRIFQREDYKNRYAWIDHIEPINKHEEMIAERLEPALGRILTGRTKPAGTRCYFARPDMSEHDNVVYFSFQGCPEILNDVDTDVVRSLVGSLDLAMLRREKLVGVDDGGQVVASWPLFDCLNFEHTLDGERYILADGEWFRVNSDFEREVDNELEEIRDWGTTLPAYSGPDEGTYNRAVASSTGLHLLDQKNVIVRGRSAVEFCDLLSRAREVVHVKRYEGAQALSHLCYQAMNSAELLKTDPEFRVQLNGVLALHAPPLVLKNPESPPEPADWTIVLAVVTRHHRPIRQALSFFSKLAVRHAYRHITGRLSFPMRLARIVDSTGVDTGRKRSGMRRRASSAAAEATHRPRTMRRPRK